MRRIARFVAFGAGAVVFATGAFLAGRATLHTHPSVPVNPSPVVVSASEGTVSELRQVRVSLGWVPIGDVVNRLPGTITWSSFSAVRQREVHTGEVLYSIDERRVVAMQGSVPAFRDLGPGAVGLDVAQVQQFLIDRGDLTGTADGRWTDATSQAYLAFRRAEQLPDARTIPLGEVLFVPQLPAMMAVTDDLRVGRSLADQSLALILLPPRPTATYSAAAGAPLPPVGATVALQVAGFTVNAEVSDGGTPTDTGQLLIPLRFTDGSAPCEWCTAVPVDGPSDWSGEMTIVPETTGVVLPIAAISTAPDGSTTVLLASGETVSITVVAQAGASAVVTGVDIGQQVVLPGVPGPA